MDTVFPLGTLKKMPFYQADGKIYGPGVLDMKSGIVVTLSVLSSILSSGQPAPLPITALFTSDEKTGSHTSRALIESLARESFTVKVTGRAAHDGGSDGNFVAPFGIPVLDGMGAIGEGYHSERENIFAESLAERTKLFAALIQNW